MTTTGGMSNPHSDPIEREAEARRIVAQQRAERAAAKADERAKLDQKLDQLRTGLAEAGVELQRRRKDKP